jgi:hypothetical protein
MLGLFFRYSGKNKTTIIIDRAGLITVVWDLFIMIVL